MKRYKTPFDAMRPALEVSRMLIEAQQVIALRLAGMAGFWPMGQAETSRMVEEKLEAMGERVSAAVGVKPDDELDLKAIEKLIGRG